MILYKEKETDLIFEAQLFEDFVLVRPALNTGDMEKLLMTDFADRFDEFWGDPSAIIGEEPPMMTTKQA